jgi:hypothetical protein
LPERIKITAIVRRIVPYREQKACAQNVKNQVSPKKWIFRRKSPAKHRHSNGELQNSRSYPQGVLKDPMHTAGVGHNTSDPGENQNNLQVANGLVRWTRRYRVASKRSG